VPYRQGKKWRGVVIINRRRVAQKLFPTKKEALEWEMEEKKRLLQKIRTVSLLEAANEYLDYCKARFIHTTYLDKRKALRDLIVHVGADIPIHKIEKKAILDLMLSRKTSNLYNRTRKDLHAFFEYCRKFLDLEANPVSGIEKLPIERTPQPIPTEEEVVRLLMAADRHDRNMLIAFIATGGRKSEILRWTWSEDINFEKRMVRLGSKKTRSGELKYRWVYMNDMLYSALQDQWETRLPHSDYVFQNRDPRHPRYGDRYTARRKFMVGLCKKAGIRRIGFHSLRSEPVSSA